MGYSYDPAKLMAELADSVISCLQRHQRQPCSQDGLPQSRSCEEPLSTFVQIVYQCQNHKHTLRIEINHPGDTRILADGFESCLVLPQHSWTAGVEGGSQPRASGCGARQATPAVHFPSASLGHLDSKEPDLSQYEAFLDQADGAQNLLGLSRRHR